MMVAVGAYGLPCLVPCPDATIAHAPFSAALARRL